MEKALEILKLFQSDKYKFESGAPLWKPELDSKMKEAIAELEALQQPKRCDGCWYGKTTINSVICGKSGTYKEADDYCKYYNPKEQ